MKNTLEKLQPEDLIMMYYECNIILENETFIPNADKVEFLLEQYNGTFGLNLGFLHSYMVIDLLRKIEIEMVRRFLEREV